MYFANRIPKTWRKPFYFCDLKVLRFNAWISFLRKLLLSSSVVGSRYFRSIWGSSQSRTRHSFNIYIWWNELKLNQKSTTILFPLVFEGCTKHLTITKLCAIVLWLILKIKPEYFSSIFRYLKTINPIMPNKIGSMSILNLIFIAQACEVLWRSLSMTTRRTKDLSIWPISF